VFAFITKTGGFIRIREFGTAVNLLIQAGGISLTKRNSKITEVLFVVWLSTCFGSLVIEKWLNLNLTTRKICKQLENVITSIILEWRSCF
jgi:hypothetical protein